MTAAGPKLLKALQILKSNGGKLPDDHLSAIRKIIENPRRKNISPPLKKKSSNMTSTEKLASAGVLLHTFDTYMGSHYMEKEARQLFKRLGRSIVDGVKTKAQNFKGRVNRNLDALDEAIPDTGLDQEVEGISNMAMGRALRTQSGDAFNAAGGDAAEALRLLRASLGSTRDGLSSALRSGIDTVAGGLHHTVAPLRGGVRNVRKALGTVKRTAGQELTADDGALQTHLRWLAEFPPNILPAAGRGLRAVGSGIQRANQSIEDAFDRGGDAIYGGAAGLMRRLANKLESGRINPSAGVGGAPNPAVAAPKDLSHFFQRGGPQRLK